MTLNSTADHSAAASPEPPDGLLRIVAMNCTRGDRVLFDDVDVALSSGEILQVHGGNGSGKTSLLRILSGLTLPTEGAVHWRGEDIQENLSEYTAQLLYLGHANAVKTALTPLENLRMARSLGGEPTGVDSQDALERIGLLGFEDVPARTLSAGQRRRVALARLMLVKARVWILDEPFTALDTAGMAAVEAMLDTHCGNGGLAVFTTHQPLSLAQRTIRGLHLAS